MEDDGDTVQRNLCGATMRLVRKLPRLGGLPELRTFQCDACGNVDTIEWEDD